jgi:dihydrofolate synthase/folylpolyglutamate synthase
MAHGIKADPPNPSSASLDELLERLDGLIDWERRDRGAAMRVGTDPMLDLCARLGAPERAFRAVHVAGTKGKGSVAALVAAGLARAGARVGLYTSPHVERLRERIVIEGRAIEDAPLAASLARALAARAAALREGTPATQATWFDVLTATAFDAFARAALDWAVIECGLGGRLDSTNVLPPGPCVITNIDLEHVAVLGSTRAAIAAEKAGIVKHGGWLVSGIGPRGDEAADVVDGAARALGVEHVCVDLSSTATIVARDAALAGALLDELGRRGLVARDRGARSARSVRRAKDSATRIGAWLLDESARAAARLPGRLERVFDRGVPVVLDGAHVPSSVSAVLADLKRFPEHGGPCVVVLGLGPDKDAAGILKALVGRADTLVCTSVGTGIARPSEELLRSARATGIEALAVDPPRAAYDKALALVPPGGWVLVIGSLHLVGALRAHALGRATLHA